jgi:hypothetical protein
MCGLARIPLPGKGSAASSSSRGRASQHERALEPANRSRIDAKGPRYIDQGLAIRQPLQRFLTLMLIELPRASKAHPAGLGTLPAIVGAGLD